MNRTIASRLTLAALLLAAGAAHAGNETAKTAPVAKETAVRSLAIGAPAPMRGLKMKSVDGAEVSVEKAAGKNGTLVVFTCNACPWAKMWESRVAEIGNAALERGIGVIAINSNDPAVNEEDGFEPMKERASKLGLKFPYVVDATSAVARAYGATRTPEVFLFDAKGKLAYHGAVDDNARDAAAVKERWLHDAVQAVATGGNVAVTETKALGCTIKFRGDKAKKTS